MPIRDDLQRVYRRLERAVFGGDRADDFEEEEEASDGRTDLAFDPDELDRRIDVLNQLGLEPETFVTRLLQEQGGRLKQQAFTDYTDWSEPTVTRLLTEMEAEGAIERVTVGREKVVCLPEHAPTGDVSATEECDSPRSA